MEAQFLTHCVHICVLLPHFQLTLPLPTSSISLFTSTSNLDLPPPPPHRQLTLQIQADTYTDSCLSALRAAARHLRAEGSQLDSRLNAAKRQINANEAAGPEFAELARRYRELCHEVDHQKWLIAEMDALRGPGEGSGVAEGGGEGER